LQQSQTEATRDTYRLHEPRKAKETKSISHQNSYYIKVYKRDIKG